MARRGRRKKSSLGLIFTLLILISIIAGAVFVYISPMFERVAPVIEASKVISANAKTPIKFMVKDNVGVKSAKVILVSNGVEVPIFNQKFLMNEKNKAVEVAIPKEIVNSKNKEWNIVIEATDSSLWNFLRGNSAKVTSKLIIDNTPPRITILANNQGILKGGSGLVIYRVDDNNLKETFVDIGDGVKFKPIRYKKDGVYATLIAWPFKRDSFDPKVVAIDSANNKAISSIDIYKKNKDYKISKIRASDKFINGKITELAQSVPEYANITDKIEKFRAVNEKMRLKNEDLIHNKSKAVTPFEDKWDIKPFKALKGATQVSDFGSKRYYYYKTPDNIISTSYHVGFDLASVKHDNLYSTSAGKVVYSKYDGIYGNMPMIDHGFGLYTLYGHCSSILVKDGESVMPGQVIAKTGKSGLALGDHVHFGVLVQGVEVYPLEWMKAKWIEDNILKVFSKADKKLGYN